MIIKRLSRTSIAAVAALGLAGCGATDEAAEDAATTTTAGETAGTASADSLDDLQISNALNLTLPDALGGSGGSSLLLQSGQKSAEACEIGQLLKEGMSPLESISNMFCHLEVESAQITFGTKYDITLSGLGEGDQDAGVNLQIWVDNSNAAEGELTVSMCRGGSLTEVFTITGVDSDGAKGSILNMGSEEYEGQEQTWVQSVVFDLNYSEAGRSLLTVKSKHTSGNDAYRANMIIDLVDEGVSNLRVSRSGSWQGDSFSQMGAAKHDGSYGQVLFSNNWTGTIQGQEMSHNFTNRAYFDADGFIVASNATEAYGETGNLYVADADVPKELASDFNPGEFAADAWDCTTDESITVDMSGTNGAAHDLCDGNRDDDWVDCYSEAYDQSEETHDIDETKQHESDHFDEVPEEEESTED